MERGGGDARHAVMGENSVLAMALCFVRRRKTLRINERVATGAFLRKEKRARGRALAQNLMEFGRPAMRNGLLELHSGSVLFQPSESPERPCRPARSFWKPDQRV